MVMLVTMSREWSLLEWELMTGDEAIISISINYLVKYQLFCLHYHHKSKESRRDVEAG